MKEFIINILRGVVVGIANVIPGVSGGTMMVSMGIYDKLILVLTHFIKRMKEAIALLVPIAIGMVNCFPRYFFQNFHCRQIYFLLD